ncbi:MAG TPA: S41 family peptidase [Drouetiella sp.]
MTMVLSVAAVLFAFLNANEAFADDQKLGNSDSGSDLRSRIAHSPSENAAEIFEKRSASNSAQTIADLRTLQTENPADGEITYYLASVLIEDAKEIKTLAEALMLLDGLEKNQPKPKQEWLPEWSLARRVDAAAKMQKITAHDWTELSKSKDYTADPTNHIDKYLRSRFDSLDASKDTIRDLIEPRTKFTVEEIRADLAEMVRKLQNRWSYVKEKQTQTGISLEANFQECSSSVHPDMTRDEISNLFRRFISKLDDGHCSIHLSGTTPALPLPFRVIDTADGIVVAEITDSCNTVEKGDVILEIAGKKVEDIVTEQSQLVSVSNEKARRAQALANVPFTYSGKQSVVMTVVRKGVTLPIVCNREFKSLPWNWNTKHKWIYSRLLKPTIGYLRVESWMPDRPPAHPDSQSWSALDEQRFKQIDATLKELATTTDIIIDVRGNVGGRDQLCCYLAGCFIENRPIKPYALRYRAVPQQDGKLPVTAEPDGFYNPKLEPAEYQTTKKAAMKQRLWILVDGRSFSATDTFLDVLKAQLPSNRVSLLGSTSQGGIGGPADLGLLHYTGAKLTASTCKAFDLQGRLLEGHPAPIDVPVQWTRSDAFSSRDVDLDTALRLIGKPQL